MKTTVKTEAASITVQPFHNSSLAMCVKTASQMVSLSLTPDEVGALLFGIEQALEASEAVKLREAA